MANVGDLLSDITKLNHPKVKCVEEIAKLHFKNKSTKFNADGLNAFTQVMKIFIGEAAARAAVEAKKDPCEIDKVTVKNEHLEKIIPQLISTYDSSGTGLLKLLFQIVFAFIAQYCTSKRDT